MTVSRYHVPRQWLRYNVAAIAMPLVEARTAAGVLNRMPYLHRWIERVHEEQLRLEAVGTSRIEGAQFTQPEQEEALASDIAPHTGLTHSQRQLRAAVETYRWLRTCSANRPIAADFVLDIHRRIVTGCDDDHCEPGALRRPGANEHYTSLKFPIRAMARDLRGLLSLRAVNRDETIFAANLDWPQQFSESALLDLYENMPAAAYSGQPAVAELSRLLGSRLPRQSS